MEARARKRRGRRALLLVTVLVVGGSALLGRALRTPEDVHRGTVSYFAPEQDATSDPRGRQERCRRRQGGRLGGLGLRSGAPAAQPAGPAASAVHRGLGGRTRLADRVPARSSTARASSSRRSRAASSRSTRGPAQAPLDAPGPRPARDEPCARRPPRLRVLTGRRRGRPAPHAPASACGATASARAPSPPPCSSTRTLYFGAEDGTLTALDARNGHRRWRVHVGGADQGLARLQRRPARRRLLRRPRLRLQRAHGHAALAHVRSRALRRTAARAASTPRRRSRTGASTSARPTGACTRSWPRRARSRGASRPAATSTRGPRPSIRSILFGSYDHRFYALQRAHGSAALALRLARAHLGLGDHRRRHRLLLDVRQRRRSASHVSNGRLLWRRMEGRYSPVVATRDAFYFTGYNTLRRLRPRGHPAGLFLRSDGSVIARGGHAVRRR